MNLKLEFTNTKEVNSVITLCAMRYALCVKERRREKHEKILVYVLCC